MCNELGEGRRRLDSGATGVAVDQVNAKNNRHTPVIVYDDLMINKHTVVDYNTNRSRPVTF